MLNKSGHQARPRRTPFIFVENILPCDEQRGSARRAKARNVSQNAESSRTTFRSVPTGCILPKLSHVRPDHWLAFYQKWASSLELTMSGLGQRTSHALISLLFGRNQSASAEPAGLMPGADARWNLRQRHHISCSILCRSHGSLPDDPCRIQHPRPRPLAH
jgi:hypothetical protein